MNDRATTKTRYGPTAAFYDTLAGLYSLGRIRRSQTAGYRHMRHGDRVLFAGAGTGAVAVGAAARGAVVTCVDLSPEMIEMTVQKFDFRHLQGELICGDILDHDKSGHYDVVAANYFLNVFDEPTMRRVAQHLVSLLRRGGLLTIADFAPPAGHGWRYVRHFLYHQYANLTFGLMAHNAIHTVYDYPVVLSELGLELVETIGQPMRRGGPAYFQTIVARKD